MCTKESKAEAVAKRRTVVRKGISEELRSGQGTELSDKEPCKEPGILGRGPELVCLKNHTRLMESEQSERPKRVVERRMGQGQDQRAKGHCGMGGGGRCYCSFLQSGETCSSIAL